MKVKKRLSRKTETSIIVIEETLLTTPLRSGDPILHGFLLGFHLNMETDSVDIPRANGQGSSPSAGGNGDRDLFWWEVIHRRLSPAGTSIVE